MKIKLLFALLLLGLYSSAQCTLLHEFSYGSHGYGPKGGLVSDGTFLYGMTTSGGTKDKGVLFKIKQDGTGYTKLLDFLGTENGSKPLGSLIYDGTYLYGMTSEGGAIGLGLVFKIKPDGTGYTELLDFKKVITGSHPNGTLMFDGTFLYGMAARLIFKIKPDGTDLTELHSGTDNEKHGDIPFGALISDGMFLYGMKYRGGANNKGVLFKLKLDGTGFTKLIDFDGENGMYPTSGLVYDGTFLYGSTFSGGTSNNGVIFKIKPDGTDYTKLLDFDVVNGRHPEGTLIIESGFLYGMTYEGGKNESGLVFKIKPDGTEYTKVLDFWNDACGSTPYDGVISDGTFLYGMTYYGKSKNGTIFKHPVATVTNVKEKNALTNLNLSPNPSSGSFQLEVAEVNSGKSTVTIYDIIGTKMYSAILNSSSETINLDIPTGIYIVKVKGDKDEYVKKLIIQK